MAQVHREIIVKASDQNIKCPDILLTCSILLQDIIMYGKETCEPIILPSFINTKLLEVISQLLEARLSLKQNLLLLSLSYMLELYKTADFFRIDLICDNIESCFQNRLCENTCFDIYKMLKDNAFLCYISDNALCFISKEIEEHYESDKKSLTAVDKFTKQYIKFPISDVKRLIQTFTKSAILSQIACFKHWFYANKENVIAEEVLDILQIINCNACYLPKSKIILMRSIRDNILNDLK